MTNQHSEPQTGRSPFGELLVALRTRRGLTQESLARATVGDRISPRSITSYERASRRVKDWVLPHRSGLRLLVQALQLDMADQYSLVTAWDKSRTLRDAAAEKDVSSSFLPAGRERILDQLLSAWNKVRDGQPQVVLVHGIAGIGKSALVRHVSDTIAASEKQVMVAWGGTSSWATEVEPYLAVRAATDRILEKPDQGSSLPGLYPSRPQLDAGNIEHIVESIPLLAGTLMSESAIRAMATHANDELREKTDTQLSGRTSTETAGRLEQYSRLLVRLSRSWPIVLVLEDLHWASEPTAALVTHLTRHLKGMHNTPILIVCTYRTDEIRSNDRENGHPLSRMLQGISHLPHVANLSLDDAMSAESGMAYIRGVVAQTPVANDDHAGHLAEWIFARTSGHPLLTGELIRHLIETGALSQQSDARWSFDDANIPDQAPTVISTFIEQRINRVDSDARRILDVASVMNDVILTEVIAEITDSHEDNVQEIIETELVDIHQLLVPGPSIRLLNQSHSSYRFPHILYRDHVYNRITKSRRKRLHLAIAQAMENRYAEAETSALAEITRHYVMAEDWHSAQMAGYRQAQKAATDLDWDLALVWYEQAEELSIKAKDPMQLWRTRAGQLSMLRATGQYEDALAMAERIFETQEGNDWPGVIALAYQNTAEVYYDLGRMDESVEHLLKAISLHLQEEEHDLAAAGHAMLSHVTHRQGKYDVAYEHAQEALKITREKKSYWVQPEALLAAANCEIELGYYEEAIRSYKMAMELAIISGHLHNQFIPPMNIGLCHIRQGHNQKAMEDLSELIRAVDKQSIQRLAAPPRLYLGYAQEAEGQLEDAAESYAAAADIRRALSPPPRTMFDGVAGQLRVAVLQKNDAAARRWYEELGAHLEQHGWEGIEEPVLVLTSVAKASEYFGDEDAYRKYIEDAHALVMERAEMIADEKSRSSYLTNVPINLEALELHADLEKQKA